MPIKGEKFIPEKEAPEKQILEKKDPDKILHKAEKWLDKDGAYQSSMDLEMLKNRMVSERKKGTTTKDEGEI